jgi:hypothetical protein
MNDRSTVESETIATVEERDDSSTVEERPFKGRVRRQN